MIRRLALRRLALAGIALVLLAAAFFVRMEILRSGARRFVFVDGGAHRGETIADFLASPLGHWYPWEIYAFEANPALIPEIPTRPNLTVLNQAVWTEHGTVELFLSQRWTHGSSVLGHKTTGELSKVPIPVPSISLGRWLEERFDEDDHVLVKLDIEGAEYAVLDALLADGTIRLVDELRVEFHNRKVGVDRAEDERLRAAMGERGIPIRGSISNQTGDWFWP